MVSRTILLFILRSSIPCQELLHGANAKTEFGKNLACFMALNLVALAPGLVLRDLYIVVPTVELVASSDE